LKTQPVDDARTQCFQARHAAFAAILNPDQFPLAVDLHGADQIADAGVFNSLAEAGVEIAYRAPIHVAAVGRGVAIGRQFECQGFEAFAAIQPPLGGIRGFARVELDVAQVDFLALPQAPGVFVIKPLNRLLIGRAFVDLFVHGLRQHLLARIFELTAHIRLPVEPTRFRFHRKQAHLDQLFKREIERVGIGIEILAFLQ